MGGGPYRWVSLTKWNEGVVVFFGSGLVAGSCG